MNRSILLVLLWMLTAPLIGIAQLDGSVLSAPDNWKGEIIPFPLGFAPDIDFKGVEDIRFAPGWSDSTSAEFWAYCFVWYIEKEEPMSEQLLNETFNKYYDGLMTAVRGDADSTHSDPLDKTLCLFVKTAEGFTGKMRVYDAFFSKEYLMLNIKVEESFCSKTDKQIVRCDISPQVLNHAVWGICNDVTVTTNCD